MSDQKKDPTNIDLDDFLDLDFGNKTNNQAKTDDVLYTNQAPPAPTSSTTAPVATPEKKDVPTLSMDKTLASKSKEELELEFANTKAKSASTLSTLGFETAPDEEEPTPANPKKSGGLGGLFSKGKKDPAKPAKADKTANAKGGLFAKKTKANNTDNDKSVSGLTTPKKKTPIALIIGSVVILLLVGVLVFVLFSDNNPEPVTPPAEPTPTTPTPPPVSEPMPTTNTTTDTTSTIPNTTSSADQSIIPNAMPDINPDEILNAEIPEDPALLKEEIDRLADTEKQLDEQSKMIKEQLDLMNDLTKAKDEEIALLEAQIAELEKQKAGK